MKILHFFIISIFVLAIVSCTENNKPSNQNTKTATTNQNKAACTNTLQKHLDAVVNRDLVALKSTLSPKGEMQLMMQGSETIHSVDSFLHFHEEWFLDSLWTMESKILSTEVGEKIGLAITESIYREPERNGKPYFNKMIVTYGLKKSKGHWYVIQDHASSIQRSTDGE